MIKAICGLANGVTDMNGGDKDDGQFSVTAPENDAEKDAMNDHFEDEDPEPTTEEVNERMGTKFEDKKD